MVYMTDNFILVCGGIYRKTSGYMIQLFKSFSKYTDIMIAKRIERMYSSSTSSELSSSSAMCISTDSRSSSYSFKGSERSDDSFQEMLTNPSQSKRSTSLIEWKRAPPVRTTQFVDGTGNVISNDVFHHATTAYLNLDNDAPSLDEIKNYRVLPTSSSAVNLPSVRSTPTISRTNSTRTNCSCFSCCMQGASKILKMYFK